MKKRNRSAAPAEGLPPHIFESRDVAQLTGISAIYLNKFVERASFGIKPSLRPGHGRGSRRWFATSDLYAIALAWWLFQAGLRSRVIAQVLKSLPRFTSLDSENPAAEVATYLMTEHIGDPYLQLLVIRIPLQRGPKKTKALSVKLEFSPNVAVGSGLESVHVIPISDLLNELTKKIEKFRPGWSF